MKGMMIKQIKNSINLIKTFLECRLKFQNKLKQFKNYNMNLKN